MSNELKTYTYKEAFECSKEYFNGEDLPAKVFLDKYALRDREGNLLESNPDDMHKRIAKEIARIEKGKFKNPLSNEEIYNYIKDFKYIVPQGSGMSGIGDKHRYVSLSNCFVGSSPLDSYSSICKTDEEIVNISKRRGGIGIDISNLRPKGSFTRNASKTSTGIIPFMERYSNTIREVGQAGRRGALIITISVHHPEVISFIKSKKDSNKITGANISVRLTDEFLKAVKNNKNYEQRFPVDAKDENKKISKMVNAKEVWDEIIAMAWSSAEPGLLFWDNIIKESPADCYDEFKTKSTNPCLTKDTWILTDKGNRQIENLIGKPFNSIVDGVSYSSDERGFYYTGYRDIYEVSTNRGFFLKCTGNHKIKVSRKVGRKRINVFIESSNLKIGDEIVLSNNSKFSWRGEGTFEEGWLCGSLFGDGVFSGESGVLSYWGKNKEEMKSIALNRILSSGIKCRSDIGSSKTPNRYSVEKCDRVDLKSKGVSLMAKKHGISSSKKIKDDILKNSSSQYCIGFIQGWMDADGTVLKEDKKNRYAIRLSNTNVRNLKIAQMILSSLGIMSTIYTNRKKKGIRSLPDGKFGYKEYLCKANHELHISKDNINKYYKIIGFSDSEKQNKLKSIVNNYKRGPYKDEFVSKVSEIKYLGKEDVYDCTIPKISQFSANGILVHNCSELPLSEHDSCRLLLLNLYSYVSSPFTKDAVFDYDKFYKHAQIAQRFMDDIVDLEIEHIDRIIGKVKQDPEPYKIKKDELELWQSIKKACEDGRRTGTGVTGIGDTIAACGLKYGSKESISLIEKIFKTLKLGCYRSSVDIAREIGSFNVWDKDKEKENPFLLRIKDEDKEIYEDMQKYGRRNIGLLTVAPAGTVSLLTQTTSGIEPCFQISYKRRKKINENDKDIRVDFVDENGDKWQEFKVYHPKIKVWSEITGETNIEKSPWYSACAEDIDWESRVKIQCVANKHNDHSISSTVNLPEDVPKEEVAKIYETAWKNGAKGITVYRKNSRSGVLIDDKKKEEQKIFKTDAPKRPKILPCDIYHCSVRKNPFFVIIGLHLGEPYEVFAGKDNDNLFQRNLKEGLLKKIKRGQYALCDISDENNILHENIGRYINEDQEAVTRLVSTALRHGTDISFVVHQLEKTQGDLQSFAKALSRILKKYISNGTAIHGEDCPECGGKLVRQEGCVMCSCGFSKCG